MEYALPRPGVFAPHGHAFFAVVNLLLLSPEAIGWWVGIGPEEVGGVVVWVQEGLDAPLGVASGGQSGPGRSGWSLCPHWPAWLASSDPQVRLEKNRFNQHYVSNAIYVVRKMRFPNFHRNSLIFLYIFLGCSAVESPVLSQPGPY